MSNLESVEIIGAMYGAVSFDGFHCVPLEYAMLRKDVILKGLASLGSCCYTGSEDDEMYNDIFNVIDSIAEQAVARGIAGLGDEAELYYNGMIDVDDLRTNMDNRLMKIFDILDNVFDVNKITDCISRDDYDDNDEYELDVAILDATRHELYRSADEFLGELYDDVLNHNLN